MEQAVVEFIRRLFDRLPYVIGRIVLFVFSWGRLRCDPWKAIYWRSDIFKFTWCRIDNYERTIVTSDGVRWTGYLVILGFFVGLAAFALWLIVKL